MKAKFLYIVVFFFLISCDNEIEKNRRSYIIENGTNFKIEIRIYNRHSDVAYLKPTSGILYYRNDKLLFDIEQTSKFNNSGNNIVRSFEGDSVKVIIDEAKFFTCVYFGEENFSEPIDRNLFKHSNYQKINNETFIYKITQQDYENATPCDGGCD